VTGRVHDAARIGFDAGAEAYERGRPGFPQEAVDRLLEELGVGRSSLVVDLAAGTGKLTRMLVSKARLVAVEPVEGMRRKFRELLPGVPLIAGVAEALPLRDGVLDALTVAQAFHWFDGPAALAEIHRVLGPGGRLGLVWNVRDESDGLSKQLTTLFDRYRDEAPAYRDRRWRGAFAETTLFEPLQKHEFRHEQRLTIQGLVDRAVSVSFIAALDPEEQSRFRDRLLELVPPGATEVVLPYRTEIHWCERR
jgi:ubiquinone/menaquinone biosynthesis C-methylase UbiE